MNLIIKKRLGGNSIGVNWKLLKLSVAGGKNEERIECKMRRNLPKNCLGLLVNEGVNQRGDEDGDGCQPDTEFSSGGEEADETYQE